MRYAIYNRDAKLSPLTVSKGGRLGRPDITGDALKVPPGKFKPQDEDEEEKPPIWPKPTKPKLFKDRARALKVSEELRSKAAAYSTAKAANKEGLARLLKKQIEERKAELKKLAN